MMRTNDIGSYSKGRGVLIAVLIAAFAFGWGWIGLQNSCAATTTEVEYINDAGVTNWAQAIPLRGAALEPQDGGGSRWFVVDQKTDINNRIEARGGGDIYLIVMDGKTLNANDGIRVARDTKLHIYGQKGQTGKINATAKNNSAGIGGNHRNAGGSIEINGCVINATGGKSSAGIGGTEDESGGTIEINGGKITAQGGQFAAGIGGGEAASGPGIVINGGEIKATGGEKGAGIGGGQKWSGGGSGGPITINGGKTAAYGGDYAAGVGGGENGDGGKITVNNGELLGDGGDNAAGIGGGEKASAGEITVNGGWVHGIGGSYGAGIGTGYKGDGGTIRFTGGNSTGGGYTGGAGIGSGNRGDNVSIYIEGGRVNGQGSFRGGNQRGFYEPSAGIGGGYKGKAGEIAINGGTILATRAYHNCYSIGHGADLSSKNFNDTSRFYFNYPDGIVYGSIEGYNQWRQVPHTERSKTIYSVYSDYYKGNVSSIRIEPCDHPVAWKNTDPDQHWKDCDFCGGEKVDRADHTYKWVSDGDKHYQQCTVCGYKTDGADHVANSSGDKCKHCEAPISRVIYENSNNGKRKDGPIFGRGGSFKIPAPTDKDVGFETPAGTKFVGWRINNGSIIYDSGTPLQLTASETVLTALWSESWSGFGERLKKGETIKLDGDVISDANDGPLHIPAGVDVTLDLNGHEIHRVVQGDHSDGEVLLVEGKLTLNDSSGDKGRITGGSSHYNGNTSTGGGIVVKGEVTMNGGTIKGNSATENGGGGVTVAGGVFTMKGGRITGNTAMKGGGIYAAGKGTVNLQGGSIDTNYSTLGAGVYLAPTNAGGKCTITISGSPKIGGNLILTGKENNLWLPDYAKIKVTNSLKQDARIGITLGYKPAADGKAITESFRNKGSIASFVSDDPDLGVGMNKTGEVVIGSNTAILTLGEAEPDEPTEPTNPTTPTEPSSAEPTKPSSAEPTEPSSAEPTKPSSAEPTKPSSAEPTKPSSADPTKPSSAEPTKPSSAEPTKPSSTDPTKPSSTDPTKPSSAEPTKPSSADPTKPSSTEPTVEPDPTPEKETVQDTITVVKDQTYILPPCTIPPEEDKVFDKWQIGNETYDKGEEITISKDTRAVPVWRDKTKGKERILMSAGKHGEVYASDEEAAPDKANDPEDLVYILAVPENGYRLAGWQVKKGGVKLDSYEEEFTFFRMGSSEVQIYAEFEPILMTDLELTQREIVLKEGESVELNAIATPIDALDAELEWDIAPDVADIKADSLGNAILTGKSAGVAELYVHNKGGKGEHLYSQVRDVRVEHKKLKHYKAKAPTVSSAGNIEYWYCPICKKYYRESEGVLEISKADTVVTMSDANARFLAKAENAINVKTKIISVKAKKKGKAVVKWKTVKGVTGYRIYYTKDKKFKKGVKAKTVKKAKTKSVTLKKLKKGKKYYVKVVPYTKVKSPTVKKTLTYYGKLSKTKAVRAKK